ncbi:MAG TPA: hypothetical protein VK540_02170 [Polyangiaceae bacterium]|nr:hypothetical protein [Polyangiaceae bacterium]
MVDVPQHAPALGQRLGGNEIVVSLIHSEIVSANQERRVDPIVVRWHRVDVHIRMKIEAALRRNHLRFDSGLSQQISQQSAIAAHMHGRSRVDTREKPRIEVIFMKMRDEDTVDVEESPIHDLRWKVQPRIQEKRSLRDWIEEILSSVDPYQNACVANVVGTIGVRSEKGGERITLLGKNTHVAGVPGSHHRSSATSMISAE